MRITEASGVAAIGAVVPLVLLAGCGGEARPGVSPESSAPEKRAAAEPDTPVRWRTITTPRAAPGSDRIRVEVPRGWRRIDTTGCEFPVVAFGPSSSPECEDHPIAVYGADLFDAAELPGELGDGDGWYGHVIAGDRALTVRTEDRATTRRVLASARPSDEDDVAVGAWSTRRLSDDFSRRGGEDITVQVPADPRVRVRLHPGIPDCEPGRNPAEPGSGSGWRAGMCRDRIVQVSAPTQALADVVAATARGW